MAASAILQPLRPETMLRHTFEEHKILSDEIHRVALEQAYQHVLSKLDTPHKAASGKQLLRGDMGKGAHPASILEAGQGAISSLEMEVEELGAQLDDVRKRVPAELAAQLAQALQHCRPLLFADTAAEASGAVDAVAGTRAHEDDILTSETHQAGEYPEGNQRLACHQDPGTASNAQDANLSAMMTLIKEPAPAVAALSPAPAALQSHLVAVAAQMPALRARLEETAARLQSLLETAPTEDVAGPSQAAPPGGKQQSSAGKCWLMSHLQSSKACQRYSKRRRMLTAR
ncbi:hypothetical protein WJX74_000607 [Apatococcus lobatus]|uniref:Uncharacterized protein n=1 Tax=Apatococcus lobatus TaxID=904363 RepID=A0AAW1QWV1_9CHLO